MISSAWSSVCEPDPVDNVMGRLNACAGELQRWNRELYGNVTMEISTLEQQLKSQIDAPSRRVLLQQIREWTKKEKILWWQFLQFWIATPSP